MAPSVTPSFSPTVPPTMAPTKTPSFIPTAIPTNPTNNPTSAPTVSPTKNPTIELRAEVRTTNQSKIQTQISDDTEYIESSNDYMTMILSIIGGTVCCIIMIFVIIKYNKREEIETNEQHQVTMSVISKQTNVIVQDTNPTSSKWMEYDEDEEKEIMENITVGMDDDINVDENRKTFVINTSESEDDTNGNIDQELNDDSIIKEINQTPL